MTHACAFDTAGRLSADAVTSLGRVDQNVDDDILRIGRGYDDVGRLNRLTSYHDAAGTDEANEVAYRYDGWGNLVREWLVPRRFRGHPDHAQCTYAYSDGLGTHTTSEAAKYVRLTEVVYPNGRTVSYGYGNAGTVDDIMSRLATISDSQGTLAAYDYLGLGTIAIEDYADIAVKLDYTGANSSMSGLDRFGRVADQLWADYGISPETLDEYRYDYDRAGNREGRENVLRPTLSEAYQYDALDRLLSSTRGDAADQAWDMDGLGNFNTVTDGQTEQDRTHNAANQLTSAEGMVSPLYDAAGNTITAPKPGSPTTALTLKYDAWNRTSQVSEVTLEGSILLGRYEYDGQGRRILKFTPASGTAAAKYEHFYLNGQQVIETRELATNAAPTVNDVKYQFINSPRYIDALILRDESATVEGSHIRQPAARLFYTSDANFNVTGIIGNENGTWKVRERYAFDPYGKVTYFDGGWNEIASSLFNNTNLYTGRTLDLETGIFYYPGRLYDVYLMRFLGKDPVYATPNLYAYCDNNSVNATDPTGLLTKEQHKKFQALITKVSGEIKANKRSSCAGFAFLMGTLYDMNLANNKDVGLIRFVDPMFGNRQALLEAGDDALWYFSDHSFSLELVAKGLKDKMPKLAGDFKTPANLTSHDLGGCAQGYIQLPGDPDTSGRHDHFLVNAAISAIGLEGALASVVAEVTQRLAGAEDSATDIRVNGLGREFGLKAAPSGQAFKDGKEVADWIFKNLCDETKCGCDFKGLNWGGLPEK